MSPAEPELSGHVPAQRHLLLDDSTEDGANMQARDDLRQSGEQPQVAREALDCEPQQNGTYGPRLVR